MIDPYENNENPDMPNPVLSQTIELIFETEPTVINAVAKRNLSAGQVVTFDDIQLDSVIVVMEQPAPAIYTLQFPAPESDLHRYGRIIRQLFQRIFKIGNET